MEEDRRGSSGEKQDRDMSLDGSGGQGRGGTFSSKKVDWTQESGSPRWKRERGENKRADYIRLLDIQV